MCLSKVDKVIKEGTGEGYKVFKKDQSYHLTPQFNGSKRYGCDKWYEDSKKDDIDNLDMRYPTGFHIFTSLISARQFRCSYEVIHKVKYEDVVASGIQLHCLKALRIVVARRMYIFKGDVK